MAYIGVYIGLILGLYVGLRLGPELCTFPPHPTTPLAEPIGEDKPARSVDASDWFNARPLGWFLSTMVMGLGFRV